jgi:hypothetical protein
LQKSATLWVREHAAKHKDNKGDSTPNMKVSDFQEYLNSLDKMHERRRQKWKQYVCKEYNLTGVKHNHFYD